MLKRAKAEAQASGDPEPSESKGERDLAQSVMDSSHQIWLAGLGAFSRAQQEGMKVFETLVRQGKDLETRTRRAAADTATAARDAATGRARDVQKMAGGTWDKLEQVFEQRVARALSKLGVYSQNDVRELSQRVDALSEAVNRLIGASDTGARPARSASTSPARTSISKRARKSSAGASESGAAKGAKRTGRAGVKRGAKRNGRNES